jgi:hypothetical protein
MYRSKNHIPPPPPEDDIFPLPEIRQNLPLLALFLPLLHLFSPFNFNIPFFLQFSPFSSVCFFPFSFTISSFFSSTFSYLFLQKKNEIGGYSLRGGGYFPIYSSLHVAEPDRTLSVLNLVSQVCDVVLMNVCLDLEDPGGVGILE